MPVNARPFSIRGRRIGPGHPAYIIAEMSCNHGGSYARAEAIVRAAAEAGADAVKLQTYTADTMTLDCDARPFKIKGTIWNGRTLYGLYQEAYTPWDWQPKLKKLADRLGIDLFSSPFDATAVDFLETLRMPAYKIASFENGDLPLLRKVAETRKPVIVSTGTATSAEVREAVDTLRRAGSGPIALLKCTSAYPAPLEEMNLRTIPHLAEAFGLPVGLSDHSMDPAVPAAAVAMGACILEKHFILSRKLSSPDRAFSLEPREFKAMVDSIRATEKAMGRVSVNPGPREAVSRAFRRSLFVSRNVRAGEKFSADNVRSIRPGHGLPPRHLEQILGRAAARNIPRGTPLNWNLIASNGRTRRNRP